MRQAGRAREAGVVPRLDRCAIRQARPRRPLRPFSRQHARRCQCVGPPRPGSLPWAACLQPHSAVRGRRTLKGGNNEQSVLRFLAMMMGASWGLRPAATPPTRRRSHAIGPQSARAPSKHSTLPPPPPKQSAGKCVGSVWAIVGERRGQGHGSLSSRFASIVVRRPPGAEECASETNGRGRMRGWGIHARRHVCICV